MTDIRTDIRQTPSATTSPSTRRKWGGPFLLGMLVVALGVVALSASVITSLVSVVFYGAMLFGSGILELILAFQGRKSGHAVPFLLAGVLSIVSGFLMLTRPMAGLVALTLLIASFLLVSGLFRGINAVVLRSTTGDGIWRTGQSRSFSVRWCWRNFRTLLCGSSVRRLRWKSFSAASR